jgi:hypothetical protein
MSVYREVYNYAMAIVAELKQWVSEMDEAYRCFRAGW